MEQLNQSKQCLEEYSLDRDEKNTDYERKLAITIINLRNGKEYELDGEIIKDIPVSVMEKIAKGICWKEKLEADLSESKYQNLNKQITISIAQLSAWQTIFKTLGEI